MKDRNGIKKVIGNSLFYSIGTVATKAISLVMLPFYTYSMTNEEYGMATTILAFIQTFCLLVLMGLRAATLRFYPSIKAEPEKKRFAGMVVELVLVFGIFVVGLSVIFRKWLVDTLFVDVEYFPLVFLGVVALIPEALYYAYQSFMQAEQRGKDYTVNSILYMFIYAGSNVVLISVFKLGVLGMVLGMLVAPTIMSLSGIIKMYLTGKISFRIKLSETLPVLKYSLPIVPHDLSSMLATYISKIFLNHSVSYAATGMYTVASQVSTALSLVQNALNLAFHPWFYEQMEYGEQGRRNIKNFSVVIFVIYCYASVFISLFGQEILTVLTPAEYSDAWKIVPILVFALVINFIYYTHILTIFYNVKASKFVAVCSITGALSNIILSYFLIDGYASLGAAVAYLLSRVITAVITVIYSRRVQKVDFGLGKMIFYSIITAFVTAIGLAYSLINDVAGFNFVNICIKGLVFVVVSVFVFVLYRSNIMAFLTKFLGKIKR